MIGRSGKLIIIFMHLATGALRNAILQKDVSNAQFERAQISITLLTILDR